MNVQEVLAKVAKLRRLATSDNIHEATRAAQMADLLLQKYRLEECSLPEDQQEQIQESAEPFEQCRKFTGWKRVLRNVLTNHYGCTYYSRQDGKDYLVYLVGRPSDLEQFKYMYAWLVAEINKHNMCMGKASRTSFAEGCVYGFAKALVDSKEKAQDQTQTSTAMVLAGRADEAKEWLMAKPGMVLKKTKVSTSVSDDNAFSVGCRVGAGLQGRSSRKAMR